MAYILLMNIFLTGEKQVGKSTLVTRILNHTNLPIYGIRSVSRFEDGDRVVYLVPALKGEISCQGIKAGICRNHHVVERHAEAFDSFAKENLSSVESGALVVIDEIGNMERDALLFNEAVLALLDRTDITVLGVLQNMAHTELSQAIRSRSDIQFFEVSPSNRDTLFETLKEYIK